MNYKQLDPQYLSPNINHHIIEIFNLDPEPLSNLDNLEELVTAFVSRNSLRVLKQLRFDFKPQGVTLMYILSASHLIIHTWPEKRYMHLDILRCDLPPETQNLTELHNIAVDVFGSENVKVTQVNYNTRVNKE